MAEPVLARPCHNGKETVGNVLVPFVCVLVMGVEQPAVVSVAPSDTGLLCEGCFVEHHCGFGAHINCRDGHE